MNGKTAPEVSKFESISEWLPLFLIGGGLALEWFTFPYAGLIWLTGFLLYGVFGLIGSIRKKYYRQLFSFQFLKVLIEISITVLAIVFFFGTNTFFYALGLILLDRFILTRL